MPIQALKNSNIVYLGLFFLMIFIGTNGAESYITVYLDQTGQKWLGFAALAVTYSSILPLSLVYHWFAGKFGLKTLMLGSVVVYALYFFGFTSGNSTIILFLAACIGASSVLLINSRNVYILKLSEKNHTKF